MTNKSIKHVGRNLARSCRDENEGFLARKTRRKTKIWVFFSYAFVFLRGWVTAEWVGKWVGLGLKILIDMTKSQPLKFKE